MFTLEKLSVGKGNFSAVDAGTVRKGSRLSKFKHDVPTSETRVLSLDQIEEGWQLLLSSPSEWLNTSKIKDIVSRTDKEVVFNTQTSTYKLTKE